MAGILDRKPDILLTISDGGKQTFTRLSTGNDVQAEDAIRGDVVIPAVHVQAVNEALAEYLKKPLCLN